MIGPLPVDPWRNPSQRINSPGVNSRSRTASRCDSSIGPTVVILPWEFGSAPREWVDEVQRRVDRVWVPSAYVRDGYIESGMPPAIARARARREFGNPTRIKERTIDAWRYAFVDALDLARVPRPLDRVLAHV